MTRPPEFDRPMKRVLFVCLGNICRSPAAEGVFRAKVEAAGRSKEFEIDSAGTIAAHAGSPADARMRRHAAARGYHLASISRPVVAADFECFDHIYAMDEANLRDLLARAPGNAHAKIHLLLELAPELNTCEVPDPYYGGAEGFEQVLDLLDIACTRLLEQM